MKLLILTQAVDRDDPNLGAFYRWWEELATRCESLTLVALRVGNHSFSPNVRVLSAGKEKGRGRFSRRIAFVRTALRELRGADAVLSHMIPEYALAVGPFARARGKKAYLWYAHGAVPLALSLALPFLDRVFTSSPAGFRLPSSKAIVTGQAIDTERFALAKARKRRDQLAIVTTGRISQVKDLARMIETISLLPRATLTIVGEAMTAKDRAYRESLERLIADLGVAGRVTFAGPRPYDEMPQVLAEHDILLNLSQTGSLDKAVLEAMAVGLPVLTSNPAFATLLPERNRAEDLAPSALAQKIEALASGPYPDASLREKVLQGHSLTVTMDTISKVIEADLS